MDIEANKKKIVQTQMFPQILTRCGESIAPEAILQAQNHKSGVKEMVTLCFKSPKKNINTKPNLGDLQFDSPKN